MSTLPLLAGVIGDPVSHSLSPKMHGYWLEQLGISGAYVALPIVSSRLEQEIPVLIEKGFAGWNVTLPHKEAMLALVQETDDVAREVGAVNTVFVRKGRMSGTNTDVYGFSENIRPHLASKRKAVVLGAGGAARAIIVSLKRLGFKEIVVVNRTEARAENMAKHFGVNSAPWDMRDAVLEGASLLVNTTTQGMKGQPALEISLTSLLADALVTDIVYTPLVTPLLADAKARGLETVDGLGMLIHQAVPGFEGWFGKTPLITDALKEMLLA